MRVFVTGATGFVGSAVVQELLAHGHQVLGLARSAKGEQALKAAGAEVHLGSLEDPESLRRGAAAADGTAHLAFIHDFAKYQENIDTDGRVIAALTDALAGSGKGLVTTFGVGLVAPGQSPTEDEAAHPAMNPRGALEPLALAGARDLGHVGVLRVVAQGPRLFAQRIEDRLHLCPCLGVPSGEDVQLCLCGDRGHPEDRCRHVSASPE